MNRHVLKVLVGALSLTFITAASAACYKGSFKGEAPCPVEPTLMDGFYVGAAVGYDYYNNRLNTTFTDDLGSFSQNPTFAATGAIGQLFVGYGRYFNQFYLAGELFAAASGASQSMSFTGSDEEGTSSLNTKFNARGSWGVSLLPGLSLNNKTLGYLRLGYNSVNLKGQASYSGVNGSGSASTSGWRSGFQYGVGLETLLSGNWSLRGEVNHTSYNSYSASSSGPGFSASAKFSPADTQALLGLVYHIA